MTDVTPLFSFKNIAKPFIADGNTVKVRSSVILRHIGNITLVNSTVRTTLNVTETETFDFMMMELMQSNRIIQRVLTFSEFFDANKQFDKMLAMNSADAKNFASSLGLYMTDTEIGVLKAYSHIKDGFVKYFASLKTPYPYAIVPENTGSEKLIQTKQYGNDYVQNTQGYKVTVKQFGNIWTRCRKVWSEAEADDGKGTVRYDNYTTKKIQITDSKVMIGCQTAPRWAVEQMADELGLID